MPGSPLRGVEEISPEVPLPFGIRTLWTAAVCGDSREVRFHLSICYRYRPIMTYDAKRTVWFRKNASMPWRTDQGFVEAFADTKSCYGLLGMPGIIAFWRNHTVLFGSQPIDGRFHISYYSSESLLPGERLPPEAMCLLEEQFLHFLYWHILSGKQFERGNPLPQQHSSAANTGTSCLFCFP